MKMKMSAKKWATPRQRRCLKKLVDHVSSHYPKDSSLHKCVKQALGAMDDAAKSIKKAAKAPRRRKAVRSTRRRATRRATRRTARKAAPRRATRRVMRRRSTRRA